MLTLEEVQNMTFRKGGLGGYRVEEVDAFLDRVVDSLRSLERQVSELESRVEAQDKEMQLYREQKESIQEALVTANATAKSIVMDASAKAEAELSASEEQSRKLVSDAEQEAQEIRTKAQEEADRVLAQAQARANAVNAETNARIEEVMNKALRESSAQIEENNRILDAQKRTIISLMGEASKFRSHLIQLYKEHLAVINTMIKPEDIHKRQTELDEQYPPSVGHQPIPLAPVEETAAPEEALPAETTETAPSVPEETVEAVTEAPVEEPVPEETPAPVPEEAEAAAPAAEAPEEAKPEEAPVEEAAPEAEKPEEEAAPAPKPETPAQEEEETIVFASVKRQPIVLDSTAAPGDETGKAEPVGFGGQRKGGRHGKNGKKRR